MDTLAFISRYEAILKEKKIAKGVFYKNCGITDSAVSQWRKGRTNPSMTNINRIADYLSVSAEYLLTGTEQTKKPDPSRGGQITVTDDDRKHIAAYHNAPKSIREAIDKLLEEYENNN